MSTPIARPRRRWLRFSLRSIFILTAACGVALALWVVPAERQRRAVAAIREAGGRVSYDFQQYQAEPLRLQWLADLLGVDYVAEVHTVKLPRTAADAELAYAGDLRSLRNLYLQHAQVTDAGTAHLGGLRRLENLDLKDTRVGDATLHHLSGVTSLQNLGLSDTLVTDAGLAQLRGLTNLRRLRLEGMPIGDAGVAHLSGLTSLEELDLRNTEVTEAGLEHLAGLRNLKKLLLFRMEVSNKALARLQAALPHCQIVVDEWDSR